MAGAKPWPIRSVTATKLPDDEPKNVIICSIMISIAKPQPAVEIGAHAATLHEAGPQNASKPKKNQFFVVKTGFFG
jgi:hypothetical protein